MVEAFNIIQDRIARARLAGDPPDLAICRGWARSASSISIAPARRSISATRHAARWRPTSARRWPASPDRPVTPWRYSSACSSASRSTSSIRALTTSPIETMPASRPPAITGRWRKRPWRHAPHDLDDGVVLAAGHDLARHDGPDDVVEDRRAAPGDCPDDVPLRDDADDPVAAFDHHQGTDPARPKLGNRILDRAVGGDGDDVAPFLGKDSAERSFATSLSAASPIRNRPAAGLEAPALSP